MSIVRFYEGEGNDVVDFNKNTAAEDFLKTLSNNKLDSKFKATKNSSLSLLLNQIHGLLRQSNVFLNCYIFCTNCVVYPFRNNKQHSDIYLGHFYQSVIQ